MTRDPTIVRKVATDFGGMFVFVAVDPRTGLVTGGGIAEKGKAPDSAISKLIGDLSEGLDDALAHCGGRVTWWRRMMARFPR